MWPALLNMLFLLLKWIYSFHPVIPPCHITKKRTANNRGEVESSLLTLNAYFLSQGTGVTAAPSDTIQALHGIRTLKVESNFTNHTCPFREEALLKLQCENVSFQTQVISHRT